MGSKRKHNQSSTAGNGQADVHPSSKKAKVGRDQANASSHQSSLSSKLQVALPDEKRQAPDANQASTNPEQDATSGLSKSARKRLRKRQACREAKKPLSADKSEQATADVDVQRPSERPLTKPVSGKSKVSHIKAGIVRRVKTHVVKSRSGRPPSATVATSSKKSASKIERSDSLKRNPTLPQSNVSASQATTKAPLSAKTGFSKKRERRRQKLALLKRGQASSRAPTSKPEQKDLDHDDLDQTVPTSSVNGPATKYESPIDNSMLQQMTQTTLLPLPKKQWIDETEQVSPSIDANLRKEVTQTSLMSRPRKEWVEEDVPVHAGDSVSNSVDGSEDAPANATNASPRAAKDPSVRSSSTSSAHSSPCASPKVPQPTEVERPFATVGLPPITQPSATRPGINTIASFSLSSRRHPVDVLAKGRKISGLSGMRMDTGNVGSVNKPVSSLKASSVPSYSGRGDVKSAFAAFNKFANGGDSSDSDDESDESESEIEMQAKKPAASNAEPPLVAPSVTTEARAPPDNQGGSAGQPDSTAHTDNPTKSHSDSPESSSDGETSAIVDDDEVSKSHESQEIDERVAETSPKSTPNDSNTSDDAHDGDKHASTEPPNDPPRMLGQRDLPLFSDFKAKHEAQPTEDSTERPTIFLGQDLGGKTFGSGPSLSLNGDDQLSSSLQVPIGDYQASQEADELYRSIEDISREVFGSTRTLPDCKPLPNSLDVTTEPFVTDLPSGHGVDLQPLQQKTPDKEVALRHIARGSSPMVYIVGGVDVAGEVMPDVEGNRPSDDDEERDIEGAPVLVDKKAETERYSSPQSSLSTLTASPTPSGRSSVPVLTSIHSAQGDAENDEDPTVQPLDDLVEEDNGALAAAEKKKRKMTGTSSKHFSPRKQPSRQINTSVKDETIEEIKTSTPEDLEGIPKPTKKKDTGKTSSFFTPTSSPVKPTATPKSKSKTPRVPAGTSTCPVPPTKSAHFGLIQEKLWQTPFWLLIAVTFLNKTTGRSAVPIFRTLQTLYPTPEDLSQANHEDLVELIAKLGLQNQRAKKLVGIAKTWCEQPPAKGRRYRCLHYPNKGDGKEYKKDEVIEEDSDDEEEEGAPSDDICGALEIAHIPGCGPYAWDSWRIFCRDVLRERAEDYNGKGAANSESFVPEWQRVLPLDKELRACLRWMWLREGWVWDCESGAKRAATEEERTAGEMGEMSFGDEGEEKFAKDAAAAAVGDGSMEDVDVQQSGVNGDGAGEDIAEGVVATDIGVPATPAMKKAKTTRSRKMSIARRELDVVPSDEVEMSKLRRSRRNRAG